MLVKAEGVAVHVGRCKGLTTAGVRSKADIYGISELQSRSKIALLYTKMGLKISEAKLFNTGRVCCTGVQHHRQ